MQGNFRLKLQNSGNCLTYMRDFIVMQMSKVNRKGLFRQLIVICKRCQRHLRLSKTRSKISDVFSKSLLVASLQRHTKATNMKPLASFWKKKQKKKTMIRTEKNSNYIFTYKLYCIPVVSMFQMFVLWSLKLALRIKSAF